MSDPVFVFRFCFEAGWRFHGGQVVATRHIEPSGKETLRRFSAKGIILEKTDPDGVQSKKLLNAQNQIIQDTDILGRVSKYAYDANGNVISSQDALGRIVDTQYDPKWNAPTSVTRYLEDGSPVTSQTQYHATNGQPTKLIDSENRAIMNARGRVLQHDISSPRLNESSKGKSQAS